MVNMDVETRKKEGGTEISVETDKEIALVVEGEKERIYLPESGSTDSTYYLESSDGLVRTEYGYKVFHSGSVENVEVFSN